jgi:hypothetical protein
MINGTEHAFHFVFAESCHAVTIVMLVVARSRFCIPVRAVPAFAKLYKT